MAAVVVAPTVTPTAPEVAPRTAVPEVAARAASPPPLPFVKPTAAPPPLPIVQQAPVIVAAPRFQPALSRNDETDLAMFDGAARRRRLQWTLALLALLGVAAAVAATIASHFRPV